MNMNIYEVTRQEYQIFYEEILPECRRTEIVELDKNKTAIKTYSKKTGKCLCSRTYTHHKDETKNEPEKYYIFTSPDNDERGEPKQKLHIQLNSTEEVQAFFDAISKLQKEKK